MHSLVRALMARKSRAVQTHSLCDFTRDMSKEVSFEAGPCRSSFVVGRGKIKYKPDDGSAGNHGQADFGSQEPTGSFHN